MSVLTDAIAISLAIGGSIIFATVSTDIATTGTNEARKRAREAIEKRRSVNDRRLIADYEECASKIVTNKAAEEETEARLVKEAMDRCDYDVKVAQIEFDKKREIKDYEASIGASEQLNNFKIERDAAKEKFRNEHNIDERLAKQNQIIEDAKTTASFREMVIKSSSGNDSSSQITKAISDMKDRTIKNANREIKKINNEVKEYNDSQDRIYNRKVNSLQKDISDKTSDITAKYAAKKNALDREIDAARATIRGVIEKNRSAEDTYYIRRYPELEKKYTNLLDREKAALKEAYKKLNFTDYTAAWCSKNNISKPLAGLLLITPIAVLGSAAMFFVLTVLDKI